MSDHDLLRLVRPDDASDSIPFDRRGCLRRVVSARVTAVRATSDHPGKKTRICSLDLRDMSDTGLGALVQEPVESDTPMTIFLPPHGPDHGFDLCGRVVRCEPAEYGYRIGVLFNDQANYTRSAS